MLPLLRYILRLLAWTDFIVFTCFLYLLSWVPWRGVHPVARMFRAWCRSFVRAIGVETFLHQKNLRTLPDHFILIANHPGALEDIGIPALFNVVSLAKTQVQEWFVVGRITRAAGTLYVDRDDRDSRRLATEAMVTAVNAGRNVALYPEGGCKGRRLYSEFKSGAFEVALRTGVPIVPVFVHCEAQDDFEWRPAEPLPHKICQMAEAPNKRVNFYVYDAIDPKQFADKYAMKAAVYAMYQRWNAQYLE